MSANSSGSSSLRPGWYKGAGGGGGRGFQPPPTVAADRGEKSRSGSWGSQERRDHNKFSALQDDDDIVTPGNGKGVDEQPSGNSRSEAFRSSFSRSASTGERRGGGRSLADLAARVPDTAATGRRHSANYDGSGRAAGSRFSSLRSGETGGSIDTYKPDPKVVRYTREKLLSMRPSPRGPDPGPPSEMIPLEGAVIVSQTCQDPVCWDVFEAEEIWNSYRERRLSGGAPKPAPAGIGRPSDIDRRHSSSSGRWQRGVALPPAEEGARRKERDAENPNELWDDPMATGAAADFSAFGGIPEEDNAGVFDFDKMAEASKKLDEELHGTSNDEDEDDEQLHAVKIDPSRPLASAGMTMASGSGDDVNVFEDFDSPGEPEQAAGAASPGIRGGDEDPNASSRLMKMIGVTREPDPATTAAPTPAESQTTVTASNPWGTPGADQTANNGNEVPAIDPIISSIAGVAGLGGVGSSSIPLNPWGNPIGAAPQPSTDSGMNLGASLEAFAAEQKAREAQAAAQRQKLAEQEELRRRQEEEAQRRALAQRQADERARQQAIQQQQASHQSQVEIVLMERICSILENSWGRSDLVSILNTLHSEDARVVPLLGNVDALRALIARSPQRVSLRHDPNFGGDMAVLLMTNSQWQQQQQQQQHEQQQAQARLQQEELLRRRVEEEKAARAKAQNQTMGRINPDLPWFYSDPQNNIQGPFRGEEMRQWLEAGYFKGDLPISQQSSGPFHPLSAIFPDLSVAFRAQGKTAAEEEAERAAAAAEEAERERERARKEAEERAAAEREREEEERRRAAAIAEAKAREAAERKKAADEAAAALAAEQAAQQAAQVSSSNGGNESSTQLKMMLGLSSEQADVGATEAKAPEPTPQPKQKAPEKKTSKANKKTTQKPSVEVTETVLEKPEQSAAAKPPPSSAWGGAAAAKPNTRKSMSEIQQEEARKAAIMAMQKDAYPRQPSSGWANVAASGKSGWGSGALKQSPAAVVPNQAPAGSRGTMQRAKTQGAPSVGPPAPVSQQQQRSASVSSTPAEEFGATMSPILEKWCKEQMQSISGSDDLTLVAFCMTLTDANEIRQYLTTYLGSTAQVNNFATEFINRRGLGSRQEEWETPGSAKKSRKKKTGAR